MCDFITLLRSKDNLIYSLTYEENEFIEDICDAIRKMNSDPLRAGFKIPARIYVYTRPTGLYELDVMDPLKYDENKIVEGVRNPIEALNYVRVLQHDASVKGQNILDKLNKNTKKSNNEEAVKPAIFIFKDLHLYFNDKDVMRLLRDLKETYAYLNKNTVYNYCPIVVTSPVLDLPVELEKIFTLFEYPLMTKQEVFNYVKDTCIACKMNKEEIEAVANACTGLTQREILRALMHSMGKHAPEKKISVPHLHEEKIQIVRKSGALDFIQPEHTMEDLGGCDNFKLWIKKVKESMSEEAKTFGIPQPKGAMLVGVPGTSKTVSAEILASYLNVPLLSLDMAKVMGSFVGQSERQIANALRIAQSIAPCVLILDEMEKTLGGKQNCLCFN